MALVHLAPLRPLRARSPFSHIPRLHSRRPDAKPFACCPHMQRLIGLSETAAASPRCRWGCASRSAGSCWPRSEVVRTLGHLGPVAGKPVPVPAQRGAAPQIAPIEAARDQLTAHPGTRVALIPVLVVGPVPRTGLGAAPPVGVNVRHFFPFLRLLIARPRAGLPPVLGIW